MDYSGVGWDQPTYHERKKQSYYSLKEGVQRARAGRDTGGEIPTVRTRLPRRTTNLSGVPGKANRLSGKVVPAG